jgi:hypothetical protein
MRTMASHTAAVIVLKERSVGSIHFARGNEGAGTLYALLGIARDPLAPSQRPP